MMRFVQAVTLLAAALFIGVSASMNAIFLSSFGRSAIEVVLLAAVSIASDAVKAVLPVILVRAIALRAWGHVAVTSVMLSVVMGLSLTSGLGFTALTRGKAVAAHEAEQAARSEREREMARLDERLAVLGEGRSIGEIEASIEVHRLEGYPLLAKPCADAASVAARRVCAGLARLNGELSAARERAALVAGRSAVQADLERLKTTVEGREADPQAAALAALLGVDPATPRAALTGGLAAIVELGSIFLILLAFGPAVSARVPKAIEAAAVTRPATIPASVDRLDWQRRQSAGNVPATRSGRHE